MGAARVFSTVGYAAASLSMISAESGVSQGSLYFHFRSKEDIARAVINEQHHRSFALVAEVIKSQDDPMSQLITISRLLVDQLVDDVIVRAGFRLGMDETALQDVAADFYDQWTDGTTSILERAKSSDSFSIEMQPRDISRLLVGFFTGTQAMSRATTSHEDLRDRISQMWHLVIKAVIRPDQQAVVLGIVEEEFSGSAAIDSQRVL